MTGRVRAAIIRHRKLLGATIVAGALYCAVLETWLPRIDRMPAIAPDLIIALSSGLGDDGKLDPTGGARLRRALVLARDWDVTLVTTRVQADDHPEVTSEPDQRRIIDSAGRVGRWVQLDGFALTTRDEAQRLRKVIAPTRIALVTSRLHTRRACRAFETLGYQVSCVSSGLDGPWWRIPFAVLYESAAWIKYKAKGWL